MERRNKQGRQAGGGRAAGAPASRTADSRRARPGGAPGSAGAMRLRPDLDPDRHDPDGRPGSANGGDDGGTDDGATTGGEMPGRAPTDAAPLPRFGGRLANLGPLDAPAAGEMPRGGMDGGLAAPLDDLADASPLDEAPADAASMPARAMDEAPSDAAAQASHHAMNESSARMPDGAMTNGAMATGDDGGMPPPGGVRRREDPDAGGEVRRREDPDAGGELALANAAASADTGPGGMPAGGMGKTDADPTRATGDVAGSATALAIGGEWRLTLSSISLDRDG